jgi:SAM-dependent methyltransferase
MIDVPIHIGIQWPEKDMALNCPKGDIKLVFCRSCGYVWNSAFDQALIEYSEDYDNSLHFSPLFQEYALSSATRLIDRYEIRNKDVIDIGCGKGDFLVLLCELGDNRGVGFDPSYEGERVEHDLAERITFIRDYYSEEYSQFKADLICCRQVLEHIQNPIDFMTMVRAAIGDRLNSVVFFEVPNLLYILRDMSIWDVIYEHCAYFSAESLAYVFNSCEFNVLSLTETFEGQYLVIEARPVTPSSDPQTNQGDRISDVTRAVESFADHFRDRAKDWKSRLEQMANEDQRTVIWGAGARGVSFLNTVKVEDQIEFVVDINPRKHGKYMAGTGQRIVSPEFLQEYQPDSVVVMNPIYENEIRQYLGELGLNPQIYLA